MQYYVEIKSLETGEVVKRMGPMGERKAEKVERGVLRQLATERYCVEMVLAEQAPEAEEE